MPVPQVQAGTMRHRKRIVQGKEDAQMAISLPVKLLAMARPPVSLVAEVRKFRTFRLREPMGRQGVPIEERTRLVRPVPINPGIPIFKNKIHSPPTARGMVKQ